MNIKNIPNFTSFTNQNALVELMLEHFGSMNKNDYEIELMHFLLTNGLNDFNDNRLSVIMQIPISKVRRLRYEVSLRYPLDDNTIKERFYEALRRSTYKPENNYLMLSIPDKSIREYLNEKLEDVGSFSDSSFNSNIVKITANDLLILIADLENKSDLKTIIQGKLNNNKTPLTKDNKTKISKFLNPILKTIGSSIITSLIEKALELL